MNKFFIVVWLLLQFYSCRQVYKSPYPISDADKTELMKLILELALVDKAIPDYDMIEDKNTIVLSKENIDPCLVPEIQGIKLILLSPREIQRKADVVHPFLYLVFRPMEIMSSDSVVVSLDNVWALSTYGVKFLHSTSGRDEYSQDCGGKSLHSTLGRNEYMACSWRGW